MSGEAALLACPLCSHTGVFDSTESLRDRLICVSTNNLPCPVCQEEFCGLDKLTIHLFSHVKLLTEQTGNSQTKENKVTVNKFKLTNEISEKTQQTKPRSAAKNKLSPPSSIVSAPMKYVKIYPKLPVISLNPVPIIDISQRSSSEGCAEKVNEQIVVKTEAQILQNNTTCNLCGLQFVDENILKMHRCLIHNIDDTSSPDSFTRHNCHLCPKHFKMRGSLMVHLRVAHYGFLAENSENYNVFKDKSDGNSSNQTQDKASNERNDHKQWQCDVCKKYFTTKYFLKKHKRLHTGETPYACLQCNKTFTFQQSYHKHLLYHNDEKPHTCNYCGRAFKELSTLHNHQRIHTGEKPFACETCGKCFRQRVSYLVHRRIHTGVMPYKCTACEKSFRYKVSQRTHKCQAQPPGTVVRQTGDLVEKLKKKQCDPDNLNGKHEMDKYQNHFKEISEVNAELARTGAKLSLEDMETESFQLFDENFSSATDTNTLNSNSPFPTVVYNENQAFNNKSNQQFQTSIENLVNTNPVDEKNLPSPSDFFKNLCLSKEDELNMIEERNNAILKDLSDYL